MSSRTLVVTVSAAAAMVALQASAVEAQGRVGAPPPAPGAPIHPLAAVNSGGTGAFTVMLKELNAATSSGTTKEAAAGRPSDLTTFGAATNVTFQNPVGTRAQLAAGQGKPGVAVVQFAPNNQMASAIGRNRCFVQGCPSELIIRNMTAQGTTIYTLKKIRLTQTQLGTPVTATFSYLEYQYTTEARTAAQPSQATYNVKKSPTS